MKRYIGTALIIFSVLCLLATIFWVFWDITHPAPYRGEDSITKRNAFLCFAAVLVIMESLLFILGRYLRHPLKRKHDYLPEAHGGRRLRPFAIYLGASTGIALLGSLVFITKSFNIGPLAKSLLFPLWVLLMCQPSILFQITIGVFGFKLGENITSYILLVIFHLVYFMVILYPLYSIATLDRALYKERIKLMKIILALFCGVHLLTALWVIIVMKA